MRSGIVMTEVGMNSLCNFTKYYYYLWMSTLIFWWFLKLLVVPENKRKFIVFSFRPVDSIVFLKLKYVLHYLLTTFLWMLVQWNREMHFLLLHKVISKYNFWVKMHCVSNKTGNFNDIKRTTNNIFLILYGNQLFKCIFEISKFEIVW